MCAPQSNFAAWFLALPRVSREHFFFPKLGGDSRRFKLQEAIPSTSLSLFAVVLAAGVSEGAAFVCEEAVATVPSLLSLQYTLKHFLLFVSQGQECTVISEPR